MREKSLVCSYDEDEENMYVAETGGVRAVSIGFVKVRSDNGKRGRGFKN